LAERPSLITGVQPGFSLNFKNYIPGLSPRSSGSAPPLHQLFSITTLSNACTYSDFCVSNFCFYLSENKQNININ